MLVNIIQNTISSFISAGVAAAASVITTNLKMWLGFETSETLGREEVVDGDFPTGTTAWNKQSNWTISGGQAVSNGSSGYIKQNNVVTNNKTYQIVFSAEVTSGRFRAVTTSDPSTYTPYITGSGTYTFYMSPTSSLAGGFEFISDAFDGSISNVSVKELTQITPDKSGNNNVGELFTGKAVEFDGINDNVNIDGFTLNSSSTTIAFTIKSSQTAFAYLLDANPLRFNIRLNQTGNLAIHYNGVDKSFGTTPNDGSFHRVVMVIDGANVNAYIDGVESGSSQTFSSSIDLSSFTEFKIGANYENGCCFFDGILSDLQFYNETWSTDDIAYDYANPNKLAIDNPSTSLNVTNLKAYWALSEGDGKLAYDSGTNLEEEEVVNGDFSNGTTGWTPFFNASLTINNERLAITPTTSSSSRATQGFTTQIGKTYTINADFDNPNSSTVLIGLSPNSDGGGATYDTSTQSSGSINVLYTATTTTTYVSLSRFVSDTKTIYYDNVSVREVTASDHGGLINGADYVDAQPRIPQLGMQNWSKGSNLFPYSEDFTEWIINSGTSQAVLAASEAAPYGQGDVYSIIMQASESDAYIRYATTNSTLTSSTHSVWVKQAPTGSATHIRITNNNRAAWNTGTSQKIALTSNWQRLETTDAITGNRFTIIGSADASGTQDSDCLGKALIYGAQLLEGSSAGVYRFTDGAATSNSTVIANPTIPTQDIFGNLVRDRLNSFNLDGTGYAEVADADSLNMSSGFSTSFWVKLDEGSTLADYEFLVCKGRGLGGFNATYGFGTTYRNNSLIATIYTSTSVYNLSFSNESPTGQWVFLCVTFEANTTNGFKFYKIINNQTYIESITTSGTVDESHNLNVGRDSSFLTSRQSKNIISDVLFYDRALLATEINNNYNAGLSAHTN